MPGPRPPYANVPIHAEYYLPSRFVISGITLGLTTLVDTSVANNYVVGQLVRLLIPEAYGTYELNNMEGYVISLPSSTQVEIDIDSRFFNAYISSPTLTTPNLSVAQIMAIGDIISGTTNSSGRINLGTFIPGSFINISP